MSIALVQHRNADIASGSSGTLAYTSNPAANNLLIVVGRIGGTGTLTISISDSIGNTWHGLTLQGNASVGSLQIFWAVNNSTAANTVTITPSAATTMRLAIYEYSGAATASPLDAENNTANGTTTTPAASSITPVANNELVIGVVATNIGDETMTAGTNFTLEDHIGGTGLAKLGVEDWIQTTATATTAPMTLSGGTAGDQWMAAIAVFKPAAGAAFVPDEDYWIPPVIPPVDPIVTVF